MKPKYTLLVATFMLVTAGIVTTAHADTLVYLHTTVPSGLHVPVNSTVVVTAATNDSGKAIVTFQWNVGLVPVYVDANVPLVYNNTWGMYVAFSSHTVKLTGPWFVNMTFLPNLKGQPPTCTTPRVFQYAYFGVVTPPTFIIPEAPVLGTLGATTIMLLGLGLWLFVPRKRAIKSPV